MNDARFEQVLVAAGEHPVLLAEFDRHQHALLAMDFPAALASLEDFAGRLARHIRLEEEELLPAYGALGEHPRGGAPEVFIEEHRKIQAILQELLHAARGLSTEPDSRSDVLRLLERELRFKGLLEHHTRREEALLFPALKKVFNPTE